MRTKSDPVAQRPLDPDRTFYATGVLLDATDFFDEQTYHRGRLARALAYLHGTGTVAGLGVELEQGAAEETLRVHPGLAIDRIGRLIELPRAACIRLDRWYRSRPADELKMGFKDDVDMPVNGAIVAVAGVVVDLYLRFVACERGKTPAFATGPFDALDAVVPSRLRDGWKLELSICKEADIEKALPKQSWAAAMDAPTAAGRREELRKWVLTAWREGTDANDSSSLEELHEQQRTPVFLARLVFPTHAPAADAAPVRTGDPVRIDDAARLIVYPTGALANLISL